jgi:hypothetical protein
VEECRYTLPNTAKSHWISSERRRTLGGMSGSGPRSSGTWRGMDAALLKPACLILHYGDTSWDCDACDALGEDTTGRDSCLSPTEMAYATALVSITLTLTVMWLFHVFSKLWSPDRPREEYPQINPRVLARQTQFHPQRATVPNCYRQEGGSSARVANLEELHAMSRHNATTWPPRPGRLQPARDRYNIRYKTIHSPEELEEVLNQSRLRRDRESGGNDRD